MYISISIRLEHGKRRSYAAMPTKPLTKRTVVSVVFYNRSLKPLVYGDPPERMDPPGKARMIARVLATRLGQGTCLLRGMMTTLELAKKIQAVERTIILTGDGRTTCPNGEQDPERVFTCIMAHNVLCIPINTVYTGTQTGEDWAVGKPLLEKLARATGGTFRVAY